MKHTTSIANPPAAIRQDAEGRFSLSDCWAASGKAKSDRPSKWFEASRTQAFLEVLKSDPENCVTPVHVVTRGKNERRGYWVVREAFIHYTAWVNPEFYLIVIRAFDNSICGEMEQPQIYSHAEALRLAANLVEKNEQQSSHLFEKSRKISEHSCS